MIKFLVGAMLVMIAASETNAAEPRLEINTDLMETTFRMTGPTSTPNEITGGTVFILGKPIKDGSRAYFVMITAAHVFEGIKGDTGTIMFRFKREDGTYAVAPYEIPLRDKGKPLYVKHPEVDVAALYVKMPTAFKAMLLPFALLATDELLRKYELHPGDELFCLGYPLLTSADHGFPILRSGKIASYPLVPAKQHKNWLFDFRVFKGNSGGPVYFVDRNRMYGNSTHLGETIQMMVGLVTSQLSAPLVNNTELQLGVIIPAEFITETLNMLPEESPYK
jgi:hypothetical protein